ISHREGGRVAPQRSAIAAGVMIPRPIFRASRRLGPGAPSTGDCMNDRLHNQMEVLSAEQVERIYRVTDLLGLHRDWVVVPLTAADAGLEMLHPDGKLLIRPPKGLAFDRWLAGLRERLERLDLGRVARREEND